MRIHARDDVDMLYAEDDLLREGSHYKIMYEGYIFDDDCITVEDLISGAVWEDGEWYA